MSTSYVFDSSALFTLRNNEEGANTVEQLLRKSQKGSIELFISSISKLELFYIVCQKKGEEEASKAFHQLQHLPLQVLELTDSILIQAGKIKAKYPLSLADSLIAASALETNSILIHKDPEFEPLQDLIQLEHLPYKKKL